jgi:benzoylformate decarboxylase
MFGTRPWRWRSGRASVWVSPFSSRASFPEDHALFAGFLVAERQAVARALARHDVIVVLGAPAFTYHVASAGPVVPDGAGLFQITSDPAAAAMAPVGESLLATLDLAVPALLELVAPAERPLSVARSRASAPPLSTPPTAEWVLRVMAQTLPPNAIVVEEAPSHRHAMHEHLPMLRSGGFYAGASGGLGWALPAAVGVALAEPARPVVALLGDGSSMYSIQALWTAEQLALPLTVVVLNNGGYGALKSFGQLLDVPRPPGVDLPGLDFVSIARGHGCAAERIDQPADLPARLAAALASAIPTLLDVPVDAAIPALY